MKLRKLHGRVAVTGSTALLLVVLLVAALDASSASSLSGVHDSTASVAAVEQQPATQPLSRAPDPGTPASYASRAQAEVPPPPQPGRSAAAEVRRAWERARDAGAYRLTSDLVQQLYPAPGLAATGSAPQRDELHVEGAVDLPAETLQLKLWQPGSSAATGAAVELKVEDGVAYTRRSSGGSLAEPDAVGNWVESPDMSASIAPGGDALAFLAGIKNVREITPQAAAAEGSPVSGYRRYSFDIDGPILAGYMRDRMEEQLRDRGKLPAGMTLEASQLYRDSQGKGEIWIDEPGLPRRLTLHMAFPEMRDGSHLEADIASSFSGFPVLAGSPSFKDGPVAWAGALLRFAHRGSSDEMLEQTGCSLLSVALCVLAMAVLLSGRRKRVVYAAVVLTVVMSMVVAPLLQSERAVAFVEEQSAALAQQEDQQQQAAEAREVQAQLEGPAWDPNQDPLTAAPAGAAPVISEPQPLPYAVTVEPTPTPVGTNCVPSDTGDRDSDGLNNYEECMRGLGSENLDPPDTDEDGLNDGVEIYQLGTFVDEADSDNDFISDGNEVRGYLYRDETWYLDPLNPDTDKDGHIDSGECPDLAQASPPGTVFASCDTDSDGTPDPFDLDSDNDGVPDAVDIAPGSWVDRAGPHNSGYSTSALQPFNTANPFALSLSGLEPGWPVVLDLQLRPKVANRLTFSQSIFDWPLDMEGQIQHGKNTTLADLFPSTEEAARHGDMQLVPMLEIRMMGSSIPLSLVTPAAEFTIAPDAPLSTTVRLEPSTGNTQTHFGFTLPSGGTGLGLYTGTCAEIGSQVGVTMTAASLVTGKLVDIADGAHAAVIAGASTTACADLPNVVNGPYVDKMVDLSVLDAHGISVREENATRTTPVLVYVPLNLMADDTGGGRVAFLAHMPYWPGTANPWSGIQTARVVWMVQAITDECDDSGFPPDLEAYQKSTPDRAEADQADYNADYEAWCKRHRTADQFQLLHSYDEDWYVTGLSVREDHGLYVAAAYENPDAPANSAYPRVENDLWQLALGLSGSFLNQRTCEKKTGPYTFDPASYDPANKVCSSDLLRDITVKPVGDTTIGDRFDAATAGHYSDTDRWMIPSDALRVKTEHYAHQDRVVEVATDLVPEILADLERKYGTAIKPLILFAREEYYRMAGLEAGTWATDATTLAHVLSINLVDHVAYPEQVLTAMSWQPFRYNATPVGQTPAGWESIPDEEALDFYEAQLRAYFAESKPTELEANEGRVVLGMSFAGNMQNSVEVLQNPCPDLVKCKVSTPNSSGDLAKGVVATGKGTWAVIAMLLEEFIMVDKELALSNARRFLFSDEGTWDPDMTFEKSLEKFAKGSGSWSSYRMLNSRSASIFRYVVAGAAVVGGLIFLTVLLVLKHKNVAEALADVFQAVGVAMLTFALIPAFGKVLKAYHAGGFRQTMGWNVFFVKGHFSIFKAIMAFVGVLVGVVLNAVSYIIQKYVGGLTGPAAKSARITMAISMVVTAALAILFLALGAIGSLIQSIIALVDMFIGAMCNAFDVANNPDLAMVNKYVCGGLTGLIVNGFKALFYSGNVMVDLKASDRLDLSDFGIWWEDDNKAFEEGQVAHFAVTVADKIKLAKPPPDSLCDQTDPEGDARLIESTFKYQLQQSESKLKDELERNAQRGLWTLQSDLDKWKSVATLDTPLQSSESWTVTRDRYGNWIPGLWLQEAYAVPFQDCPMGYCSYTTQRGTNSFDLGQGRVFDALPNGMHGFLGEVDGLASSAGVLAAGGIGPAYPSYDADNDGLPATADANDFSADRDGDGLLDSFEIEQGSSPDLADTDFDGLLDQDEVRAGTNPRQQDTDGDGLRDPDELYGWEITYDIVGGVPLKSWVRSDPLEPDTDADTLSDSKEKVYGFNPYVASSPNVLTLNSGIAENGQPSDGFVRPGDTVQYTATVKNELMGRWAQGLLQPAVPAGLSTSQVTPREFELYPQKAMNATASLAVAASASGAYTLTQTAGALITNWSDIARGARLYLPFDDTAAPLGDRSGSIPSHDGACLGAGGVPSTACAVDSAGKYANALSLTGASYVRSEATASQTGYAVSLWFKTTTRAARSFFMLESLASATAEVMIGIEEPILNSLRVVARIRTGANTWDTVWGGADPIDGRWHHVVQTMGPAAGDAAGVQKLYLDGVLIATGAASRMVAAPGAADIGRLGFGGTDFFVGSVDDVRLFDHALTPQDVRALYDMPVLNLGFDQASLLVDTSPSQVSFGTMYSPGKQPGVAGNSANFEGEQWIRGSSKALDLSEGHFTLATWVYPTYRSDERYNNYPQGILGNHSGEADGYPTLQRVGKKVRFGFGAALTGGGAAWQEFTTTGDVLVENAWNHVAATYDKGTHTGYIYVNGQLKQANSAAFADVSGPVSPATPPALDIGRSGDLTSVTVSLPNVCDNGEYNWLNKQLPAEWCFTLNGNHLLRVNEVYAGSFTENATGELRTDGVVKLWEDDNDVCTLDSKSNVVSFQRDGLVYQPMWFTSNEVGDMTPLNLWYNFADSHQDWCGQVRFRLSNTSIPFYGRLDDLRIYNQVLDDERITRLYEEGALALRLKLDDPPGTRAFRETSAVRAEVGCTACPTAGLPGRVDQAPYFGGSSYLTVKNGPANQIGTALSVMAWVRPEGLTSLRTIVSTAAAASRNGWQFQIDPNNLRFELFGVTINASGAMNQPGIFQDSRWHHVAAVLGDGGYVSFYVDGQFKSTYATPLATPIADTDDQLLIGASLLSGVTAPVSIFKGMIDDVRVYRTALSAEQVRNIYDEAPAVHLRFDEARGATSFVDSARAGVSATCTAPRCPAAGDAIAGEIGLAAAFDGKDDVVRLPAASALDPAVFTVGAWVKPGGRRTSEQRLVSKGTGTTTNYRLSVDANSLVPRLTACSKYVTSTVPLVQGQWSQVMGTYDGSRLRLYVNGTENNSVALTGSCTAAADAYIGGDAANAALSLAGQLDEVVLYPTVLHPWDVYDLFTYQNAWVEDREIRRLVVDSDAPTAAVLLESEPAYLPKVDTQIAITATDRTSGIASAVLLVNNVAGAAAPLCNEGVPGSAWCAPFRPTAQGVYNLAARATDLVARQGAISPVAVVRVDDSKPNVTLNGTSGQRLDAAPDPARPGGWLVPLSGVAADPNLSESTPGSGIPDDGVRVTVYDANGGLAGPERQLAIVNSGIWSLQYPLSESQPGGCYTVAVEASDNLAGLPGLSPSQVAAHRTIISPTAGINASAPSVQLDRAALTSQPIISGTTQLNGVATSRPVPVRIEWTTGSGGAGATFSVVCSAPGSPATFAPYSLPANKLAADNNYSWAGEIHRDAACSVQIASPAGSGAVLRGSVTVCGQEITSWTDNGAATQSIAFAAASTLCPADTCSGTLATAGVGQVDVAFTPLLPGPVFVDEPADEVLNLSLDEEGQTTTSFRDTSPSQLNATCTGASCPANGRVGHSGSALWFDGVDDYLTVPDNDAIDPGAAQDFTVALWVRPESVQPTATNSDSDIVEKWAGTNGYSYVIRYLNQLAGTNAGKISVARYDGAGGNAPSILSTKLVNDGHLHHVAFVKRGGALALYIDGQPDGETPDTTVAATTNASDLYIGRRGNGINSFAGLIDELRIFGRGLSQDEIRTLYAGAGPLLKLDFEDVWLTGGATLTDKSGWQHGGVLNAGTGDTANKAVTGQVGAYALSLDGADDYVDVGEAPGLKLTGQGTLAAWVYPGNVEGSIISREGEYMLNRDASGLIRYAFASSTPGWSWIDTHLVAPLNTWTHIAVVYDLGVVQTYLNGALAHTYTGAGSIGDIAPTQNKLMIGSRQSKPAEHLSAGLDDVRIYARALAPQEVRELVLAGWQQATLNPAAGVAVQATRWSTAVPAGLEGTYRVDLRSWDAASNPHVAVAPAHTMGGRTSPTWSTPVDSLAPRVKVCRTSETGGGYTYITQAQDFNLVETGFRSPCGPGVITARDYFGAPWYLTAFAPSEKRLYGLTAVCSLPAPPADETAHACDSAGNCTTSVGLSTDCATPGATAATGPAGEQAALDLRAAEEAAADNGQPRRPWIAFVPDVITATHLYRPRSIELTGIVSGTSRLSDVDVRVGDSAGPAFVSEPEPAWPFTRTWSYTWSLPEGDLPDGLTQTAVATATVQSESGQRATTEQNLTLDVMPPGPVAMTLSNGGDALTPGAVVRATDPELTLGWTGATDGSGVAGYLARWTATSAATTTVTTHAITGLEDSYAAGEAEKVQVELGSHDLYGNLSWQEFGAVYVDTPQTPDFTGLDYDGWMEGGCSLLGTDRRTTNRGVTQYGRGDQQLFGTWDHEALRLAWTGANWSGQGDLFIYLDTAGGGTSRTFTPFPTPEPGTVISLPGDLSADYLVWVHSSDQATLLNWVDSGSGGEWTEVTSLTPAQFRFGTTERLGQTDLYLPFELLGMTAGAPLGLLAFATEEPAEGRSLQLWSTLPMLNPVNSPRVSLWARLVSEDIDFSLRRAYRWAALGDGVCPAGVPAGDLEMTVAADPPGASLSGQGNGLFWVSDPVVLLSAPSDRDYGVLAPRFPPLAEGQEVQYTLHYRNRGDKTANGVWLVLSPHGQVRLLDETVQLGDIPPGGEGEATFRAVADRSKSPVPVAAIKALVYDSLHTVDGPAMEWIWVAHRVDRGAPESGNFNVETRIGARTLQLNGVVDDEAGVKEVTIEVQGPEGAQQFTCQVANPLDGTWACNWESGAPLAHDTLLNVRMRATDNHNQVGEWSEFQTVQVDATPPIVTFDATASGVVSGAIFGGRAVTLYGTANDPSGVAAVQLCKRTVGATEEVCGQADLREDGVWSFSSPDVGALDYVSRSIEIYATDAVGNRTPDPLIVSVFVDNVAPQLTATQLLGEVMLGRTKSVLGGTMTDGSETGGGPAVDVSVRVQPPSGEAFRADVVREGNAWHYDLAGLLPGRYTLWGDAKDAAGNLTSAGPFEVAVTCADANVGAAALTAEPAPEGGHALMFRATVRNAGPDPVPAGLSFVISATVAGGSRATIATPTTAAPLAAGATETFVVDWATETVGAVDIGVEAAGDKVIYAGEVALCGRPEAGHFEVLLQDVPLYAGWNLVTPPVEPFVADIATVQRTISGAYRVIVGYENGLRTYDPAQPDPGPLAEVRSGRGYWIRSSADQPPLAPGAETRFTRVATLRIAGERVAPDKPLPLAAGLNLLGYLPDSSIPVTVALSSVDGAYASVLGYAGTATSYYPGIDAGYNTLVQMRPSAGYWISMTRAMTLEYPSDTTIRPTITDTLALGGRLDTIYAAERAAGVQPTYRWVNLYGLLYLPDDSPAPAGTTVTVLADGQPCGATVVTQAGRFGLLACYGDDETTPDLDGAGPDAALTFLVNGEPAPVAARSFNGQPVPRTQPIRWTALGDRWEVVAGNANVVNLTMSKTVTPATAAPGATIQYSLTFSNAGDALAQGVVLTDLIPPEITNPTFTSTGAAVTPRSGDLFVWDVEDLSPGEGGVITITGLLDPNTTAPADFTNTASIAAPDEAFPDDNEASAILHVRADQPTIPPLWLPLVWKNAGSE